MVNQKKLIYAFYESIVGKIVIIANQKYLIQVCFENKFDPTKASKGSNSIIQKTIWQLDQYFKGKRKRFTLLLSFQGTAFQKNVWEKIREISYGKTISYQQIGVLLNKPQASRAVGNATRQNPFLIIIPCHRVIGKNKNLIGYVSDLEIKKQLLLLEKKHH